MTKILLIESNPPDLTAHGQRAAAGFEATLKALDPAIELTVAAPYAAPFTADLLAGIDGAVFTGSAAAWATDAVEAAPLRQAMELTFAQPLPVWGSCNGLQLAAVVLGGTVGAAAAGLEVGLAQKIALTQAGRRHAMLAGRKNGYAAPAIHRDAVKRVPHGAVTLAGNAHSPVQAMAYAQGGVDFWGTQYHPELALITIAGWVRARGLFAACDPAIAGLADGDESNAARELGLEPHCLTLANRALELRHWLSHVRLRAAQPLAAAC